MLERTRVRAGAGILMLVDAAGLMRASTSILADRDRPFPFPHLLETAGRQGSAAGGRTGQLGANAAPNTVGLIRAGHATGFQIQFPVPQLSNSLRRRQTSSTIAQFGGGKLGAQRVAQPVI